MPTRVAPDPQHFVETVAAIATLAPAIRAREISFVPRRLAMEVKEEYDLEPNDWAMPEGRKRELARRSLRLWLSSAGVVTPLFGDAEEEDAFATEAGLLGPLVNTAEAARLHRIACLALPRAGDLDIARMIQIRQDDFFEEFRARQRAALAAIGAGDGSDDRSTYREEMEQAARELDASVKRSGTIRSWIAGIVGWSVGALVLAPESWLAAISAVGGVTTQIAAERMLNGSSQGKKAVHHHYATLGGKPDLGG